MKKSSKEESSKDKKPQKISAANFCKEKFEIGKFNYQNKLTKILDAYSGDFDQAKINEIILWKVNRYASLENEGIFEEINKIQFNDTDLDEGLTKKILKILLNTKGIRLPVASTILRFKNPNIYQIIDQRVYRFMYGEEFRSSPNIEKQINLYLEYLKKLKEICEEYKIKFKDADRILYMADKEVNKGISLKNYGSNTEDS